jgi:peptidoglycan/LPS O-acetylase OafA/YrhL
MWYVGLLIFLYAITLFWARGGLLKQMLKFIITMGIIAGIQLIVHSVDSRTFFYAVVYFLGIIVGQYYFEKFFSLITKPKFVVVMLMVFLALLIVQINRRSLLLLWGDAFVGMVALMSLYVYLGEKWKDNKHLVSTVSMLSYASFCIYLFHREVFAFLLMIWRPAYQYQMIPYLSVLGLAIVIPLAYYIQKGYDGIIKKLN